MLHRVDVADLTGQVEHDLHALDRRLEERGVGQVEHVHFGLPREPVEVAAVPSAARVQRVDDPDLGSALAR